MGELAKRSLIFSSPMVKAIFAGKKTVTRRLLSLSKKQKLQPSLVAWMRGGARDVDEWRLSDRGWQGWRSAGGTFVETGPAFPERLAPGARVWVRETFSKSALSVPPCPPCWYRADFDAFGDPGARDANHGPHGVKEKRADCFACVAEDEGPFRWSNSRFMPRALSRLTLEIVSVRIERLQAIDDADARAEGIETMPFADDTDVFKIEDAIFASGRDAYCFAWDGLNGSKAPSESNPFVRRIEFRRVSS